MVVLGVLSQTADREEMPGACGCTLCAVVVRLPHASSKETLGALELACGAINCVLPYPAPSRPTLPSPRRNATGKELPVIEVGALAPKPKKGDVITALWTTGAVGQFQPPTRNVTVQVGSALCLACVWGGAVIERPHSVLVDGQRTVWGF